MSLRVDYAGMRAAFSESTVLNYYRKTVSIKVPVRRATRDRRTHLRRTLLSSSMKLARVLFSELG